MKPAEIIMQSTKLDADKDVACQVVANDGSAWNMCFAFEHTAAFPVLRVTHPQLDILPKEIGTEDQRHILHIDIGRDIMSKDIECIKQMFAKDLCINIEPSYVGNVLRGYSIVSGAVRVEGTS